MSGLGYRDTGLDSNLVDRRISGVAAGTGARIGTAETLVAIEYLRRRPRQNVTRIEQLAKEKELLGAARTLEVCGRVSMIHEDFLSFMRAEVLPRRAAHPKHIRLDGALTGGSRDVVGRFRHNGVDWVVHADTHYEPLMLAYEAAEAGADPFVEERTARGRCLALTSELRARQVSRRKYMYIYSWTPDV